MFARHLTLDGAASVDIPRELRAVQLVSRDGAAEVWFRIDGESPVVAGDDSGVLPASVCAYGVRMDDQHPNDAPVSPTFSLSLLSLAPVAVSVIATVL